ncbi:MAG: hypothetical protein ACO1OG_03065 [Devosia sp.]
MKISMLAVAVAMMAVPQVAVAQEDQTNGLLHAVYGLWGMMDGAANFCWEDADYDVSYMEAHQNWLARNVFVRDELDGILAASGEDASLASGAEAFGSNGIVEILTQAVNQAEACANWRSLSDAGSYDAEVFMAEQLGILRERDGM